MSGGAHMVSGGKHVRIVRRKSVTYWDTAGRALRLGAGR